MALNDYAYYRRSDGFIENVILIDDETVNTLVWPDGYAIVDIPNGLAGEWSMCGIGWSYINGKFIEPPKPAGLETPPAPPEPK